jgi:hypothetical protein
LRTPSTPPNPASFLDRSLLQSVQRDPNNYTFARYRFNSFPMFLEVLASDRHAVPWQGVGVSSLLSEPAQRMFFDFKVGVELSNMKRQ